MKVGFLNIYCTYDFCLILYLKIKTCALKKTTIVIKIAIFSGLYFIFTLSVRDKTYKTSSAYTKSTSFKLLTAFL